MNQNEITVLDAGMGKTLSMRGVDIPGTIWSANALIVAADVVVDVHKENIAAGARVITTNSYGIIRSDLAKENIEDQFEALNQSAGELAKRAVQESRENSVEIAGSLPPLNGSYRPDLVLDRKLMDELYQEQAKLLAPYVDLFICETMSTIEEASAAANAAKETGLPVLIALTLDDDRKGCLRSGERVEDAVDQLCVVDPIGILANCCLPERITDAMPLLSMSGLAFRGGYANAFSRVPRDFELDGVKESDRKLPLRDDLEPDLYARFVEEWLDQGANIVGGCCGTTAKHTQAITGLLASRACA
ncbi:MAG TPA: homocysteine S-methyltransferase family protein [Pseudomonadales bacterium]|jgi:S-methylmethionine-dependent homocysteine/selenocysteine methylase|nr:homocysteine S-methyltransferase [Gammaproteobacteria bacterium]MDP6025842.1 homocysteine S-methyltransferase family protein [Pseudomonadales bacterium]MDP6315604.1 homocysteine S-methyltransferase family protein [Pseudomonadales bacterium]MDP7316035.1 homocysteine S-methyltransferase family protein [Pseudomonadales bacterium]MDP7576795.1 homocysteine S-methyltransferase family protein [Pseudomonadales bacterium]|tara:strand:+ start:3905 stop:4816 length:912 start_codon:yes stop_codon:yes gene_type:complete